MTEAVFCFPVAWKAWPWTSSSSATSTRGQNRRVVRALAQNSTFSNASWNKTQTNIDRRILSCPTCAWNEASAGRSGSWLARRFRPPRLIPVYPGGAPAAALSSLARHGCKPGRGVRAGNHAGRPPPSGGEGSRLRHRRRFDPVRSACATGLDEEPVGSAVRGTAAGACHALGIHARWERA
jgi:hypothetical protein